MMYNNKLIVAVKTNNKVLREFGDKVYIPTGSEYSLLIKNLNSSRAKVSITIDGQDVMDGQSLVVNGNDQIELERFIKNGNITSGNKFKFITRTAAIEQHRGIDVSDGLIRVEFQYESAPLFHNLNNVYSNGTKPRPPAFPDQSPFWYGDNLSCQNDIQNYIAKGVNTRDVLRSKSFSVNAITQAEVGITVPGSISKQQFTTVSDFYCLPDKHVIVLQMLAIADDCEIVEPITVKHKPKCITCGRVNKAKSKFCDQCGTSLTII